MTPIAQFARIQPAIAYVLAHLDQDVPLAVLSGEARLSSFYVHRVFRAITGETPKQYTLRLRLSRGAALLLSGNDSVLSVAQHSGFRSHEAFTRAFRRQFGVSPRRYRESGLSAGTHALKRRRHATVVQRIGPCVGLYHLDRHTSTSRSVMNYSVVRKDLAPQPVLMVRRRIKRTAVAATIGEVLPAIFQYAQQHGIALTDHPLTRYSDMGFGHVTIEPGMRIGDPGHAVQARGTEGSAVIEETLPGGPAATTVHTGPYDTLSEAYAAVEAWIESHQLEPAGAPWEYYITDPAEFPDPKDWRTEVFWPLRA
jgi:AraC family transcriptional regulator